MSQTPDLPRLTKTLAATLDPACPLPPATRLEIQAHLLDSLFQHLIFSRRLSIARAELALLAQVQCLRTFTLLHELRTRDQKTGENELKDSQ